MMFHRLSILSVLGLFLGLFSLRAQTPDAEGLLESWLEAQRQAYDALGPIELTEHSTRVLSTPRGQRVHVFVASLSGMPGENEWDRHVESAEINGTPLDLDRHDRLDQRFAHDIGLPVVQAALYPARWLNRLRIRSEAEPDEVDGVPTWRVELDSPFERPLLPGRRPPPFAGGRQGRGGPGGPPPMRRDPVRVLERVTIWLTHSESPRLLRAHLTFRLPHAANANVLDIAYGAFDQLDVPEQANLDGLLTQRRRLRVYTVRVNVETVFSGYRRLEPDERP